MYISASSTMTSVLRFSLTASIDDGNSSSQIIDCRCELASETRALGWVLAHLGVDYLQLARTGLRLVRGADEGDERRAEQHLDSSPRAIIYYQVSMVTDTFTTTYS